MALKTDLSDMSIVSTRASVAKVNVTLKIWESEDNTVTDTPLLEEVITENNVKVCVEGETPAALAARIKRNIKAQAQGKIDYYQTETKNIDTVTSAFQDMITEVDGELQSKSKEKI